MNLPQQRRLKSCEARGVLAVLLLLVLLAPRDASATLGAEHPLEESWRPLILHGLVAGGSLSLVFVGDTVEGVSVGEVEEALTHAATVWSGVSCSTVDISYAGRQPDLLEITTEVPVLFVDPAEEPCFPDESGFLAWTSYSCGDLPSPTIFLNGRDYRWRATPDPEQDPEDILLVDAASVITHELGHVLGLTHTDVALATMVGTYLRDGGQATLAADDKFKICALFPGGPSECKQDSDCRGLQSCEEENGIRVCEEERGVQGSYCTIEVQICPEFCLISSSVTRNGYCSTGCDETLRCDEGYTCAEGGVCQVEVVAPEAGCSTISVAATWPAFSFLVLVLGIRISIRSRSI